MRKCAGLFLCLASLTALSAAQLPGGSVYVGYTYLTSGSLSSGPLTSGRDLSNLNGFNVSGELKLLPWISGVAEYGGNFGTERVTPFCEAIASPCPPFQANTHIQTFLFGPRASVSIGRFRPFSHVLLGGAHLGESGSGSTPASTFTHSETGFATALGGGLDYKLIKGIAWRIQADDLRTDFFNNSHHNFRFTTGIVFRF
jgi:Outer membrane protein beta-barrel domain